MHCQGKMVLYVSLLLLSIAARWWCVSSAATRNTVPVAQVRRFWAPHIDPYSFLLHDTHEMNSSVAGPSHTQHMNKSHENRTLGAGVWVGGDFNGWDDGAGALGVKCHPVQEEGTGEWYWWAPENTISVGDAFLFFVRDSSGLGQWKMPPQCRAVTRRNQNADKTNVGPYGLVCEMVGGDFAGQEVVPNNATSSTPIITGGQTMTYLRGPAASSPFTSADVKSSSSFPTPSFDVLAPQPVGARSIPLAARNMEDLVVYELHVPTFSPTGDFIGLIDRLDYLAELGINAIEVMPVTSSGRQFPASWGYDPIALFSVERGLGGWAGMRDFVNQAHRRGILVIVDVVLNHADARTTLFRPDLTNSSGEGSDPEYCQVTDFYEQAICPMGDYCEYT